MGWIIATILMAIDQAVGVAISNKKQATIQKRAKELAKQISADRALVNQLHTAYTRKDGKLANSLIGASPFGSYFRNTTKAIKDNDVNLMNATTRLENINRREEELNNKVAEESAKHQTSGSVVIDLISGTAQKPVNIPSQSNQLIKENNNNVQTKI